jgi:hypothetical protein
MLNNLTLSKFAEVVGGSIGMGSSNSTGVSAPPKPSVPASSVNKSSNLDNTLAKARNNADIQPLERDHHALSPTSMPSYGMNSRKVNKTSSMSKLEDRRMLDAPIGRY